ncbi:hypothetical protein GCM10009804_59110 [Kribbella hippodromi]|uniref:4'-phosphopantetheinyl transferase superfamily protein n=1 Tax=Kribbella hippodromi TaxID=434347 RepID=A0ABP4Q452_9ACTN
MIPSAGSCRPSPPGGADGFAAVLTVPGTPAGRLLGAGVDLLDQQRFALAAKRVGPAWLDRIFDESERAGTAGGELPRGSTQLAGSAQLAELARLFGIKECVIKIVGGLPVGAGYRDIVVATTGGDGARPIRLRGELARWAGDHRAVLAGGVLAGGVLQECQDTAGSALDLCWAVATEVEEPR